MTKKEQEKIQALQAGIMTGSIVEQKAWKFVRQMNSCTEEKLNKIAIIDGRRKYTYSQFFRSWDKYAEVFAALGITEENGSRVGMIGNVSAECIIAFYALNMLGVSVSMLPVEESRNEKRWCKTIRKEGITDLVIAGTYAWPGQLRIIADRGEELGIRKAIVLPTYVDGRFAAPIERIQAKFYEPIYRISPDVEVMDELFDKYETTAFTESRKKNDEAAVITHTSGTTKGIHKPIPLSDVAINSAVLSMMRHPAFQQFSGGGTIALTKEMTAAYCMVNMVHAPLALGLTNVMIPMGALNPNFHKAIKKYKINVLMTSAQQFEAWMDCPAKTDFDFSSLDFVTLGGAYVSPDTLNKINSFIRKNGGHAKATSGYGLSEAGGACIMPDPGSETADTIGKPLPGVDVRIYDEDKKVFYTLEDGTHTGGLYISSPAMSSGRIGDTVFFETEEIDGKPFICTYDLVSTSGDGSLTYAGRMNRFFANNEGIEFNAGRIETALSKQEGIEACAVVPEYDKSVYDTIPVLYVQTAGGGARRTVKSALLQAFEDQDKFDPKQLPKQCVITDNIPYNATGKVDINLITKGYVDGTAYSLEGVVKDGALTDIRFVRIERESKNRGMGCDQLFG